jgi:hypothetical protein
MLARDAEHDPPPSAPEPLKIPKPDWEAEAAERAAREHDAEEPANYPAKRKRKPKPTPRLDSVRAWQEADA